MSAPATEPFLYRHRVTYAECTIGNHIYHSRYLDILEAARGEFMRHVGQSLDRLQTEGFIFPVIQARLNYHRPARYDEVLDVAVSLVQLTPLRLGVYHEVRRQDGTLVLEAVTRHVCTSPEEKPRRMSKPLVAALRPWLGVRPRTETGDAGEVSAISGGVMASDLES